MIDWGLTVDVSEPGRVRAVVTGEVDASNAEDLCLAILHAASKSRPPLEVDLAGVTFMDSTGLRALTDASVALAASGSGLALRNVPRQVRRIMSITDMAATLEVSG